MLGNVRLYINQMWLHCACLNTHTPWKTPRTNASTSGVPAVCTGDLPKGLFLFHRFAFTAPLSAQAALQECQNQTKARAPLPATVPVFGSPPQGASTVAPAPGSAPRVWQCPPGEAVAGCRDSANSCRLCLLQGKLEQNNYYHCVFHPYFIVAIIFISVRG